MSFVVIVEERRIDPGPLPPHGFVTLAMELTMMSSTQVGVPNSTDQTRFHLFE
jgi:hypothetical protein